jgi:hypothetical protein
MRCLGNAGHHSFQPFQRELLKEFNQASNSHKLLGAEYSSADESHEMMLKSLQTGNTGRPMTSLKQ